MTNLQTMRDLRSDGNYDQLISMIKENKFNHITIHEFIVPELGFINFNFKLFAHDEDSEDMLLTVTGGSVKVISELIESKMISEETLKLISSECKFSMLAELASIKLYGLDVEPLTDIIIRDLNKKERNE